jgi:peptide/nickel transport system permease protein
MTINLLKRLLEFAIVLLLGVTTIFLVVHLAPGDPSYQFLHPASSPEQQEFVRQRFGLDKPLLQQYLLWLKNVCYHFDFGYSFYSGRPVKTIIGTALGSTLLLTSLALCWGVLLGVWLGVKAALKADKLFDRGLSTLMLIFYSMPSFWLGLILLQIFAIQLNWLPTGQLVAIYHSQLPVLYRIGDYLVHLILPVTTMGIVIAANFYRHTRNSMLNILQSPYVVAARARGLSPKRVIYHYALRNALSPLISLIGTNFPYLFSGALMIEVVFSLPGLGRVLAEAAFSRDYPVIIAAGFLGFLAAITGNLLADMLHLIIDPRLRHTDHA